MKNQTTIRVAVEGVGALEFTDQRKCLAYLKVLSGGKSRKRRTPAGRREQGLPEQLKVTIETIR